MPSLQAKAAYVAFQAVNLQTGRYVTGTARVDTGADVTLVDLAVIAAIGASPTGNEVVVGIDGVDQSFTEYVIALNFGTSGYVPKVRAVGLPNLSDRQGIQALVGKDVLSTGIFDYSGLTNTFTFQVGIGQGPPISPVQPWVLPAALAGIAVGLAGLVWMMTG